MKIKKIETNFGVLTLIIAEFPISRINVVNHDEINGHVGLARRLRSSPSIGPVGG